MAAPLRLCALARNGLFIQAPVLAKAQRPRRADSGYDAIYFSMTISLSVAGIEGGQIEVCRTMACSDLA